jgi:hypothetical protein
MPYTLIPLMLFLSTTVALGNTLVDAPEPCPTSVSQETQNPETVSVVGSGSGLTVESAKQDALRDVVEKAVGLLVDAKTILENDKLIESVLTYSGAYVESYKVTSTVHEESGLVRIKIFAEVRKTKLHERLIEVKIIKAKVDGTSLAAKLRSKREEKASAADIVHRAFEGFPGNVLKASLDGEPEIVDEGKEIKITTNVLVQVDAQAWAAWKRQADQLLKPLARKSGHGIIVKERRVTKWGEETEIWDEDIERGDIASGWIERNGFESLSCLRIRTMPAQGQESSWYFFEGEPVKHELILACGRYLNLQVSLLSAEGNVIATKIVESKPVNRRFRGVEGFPYGYSNDGRIDAYLTPVRREGLQCWGSDQSPIVFGLTAAFYFINQGDIYQTTGLVVPVDFNLPLASLEHVSEISVAIKEVPYPRDEWHKFSCKGAPEIFFADWEKSHHPVQAAPENE